VIKQTRMPSTCSVCGGKGHIAITVEQHWSRSKAAGVYVFTRELLDHRADCQRTKTNPAKFQRIEPWSSLTTKQETA